MLVWLSSLDIKLFLLIDRQSSCHLRSKEKAGYSLLTTLVDSSFGWGIASISRLYCLVGRHRWLELFVSFAASCHHLASIATVHWEHQSTLFNCHHKQEPPLQVARSTTISLVGFIVGRQLPGCCIVCTLPLL